MSVNIGYVDCEECGRGYHQSYKRDHFKWHDRVIAEYPGRTLKEKLAWQKAKVVLLGLRKTLRNQNQSQ